MNRKYALVQTRKLWRYLAETGNSKGGYFYKCTSKYYPTNGCYLCEYAYLKHGGSRLDYCGECPYYQTYGESCYEDDSAYSRWEDADGAGDVEARKIFAKAFLKEMRGVK